MTLRADWFTGRAVHKKKNGISERIRMRTGRKTKLPDKKIIFLAAGIVIAITVVILAFIYRNGKHERSEEKVTQGIAYLESLENQDTQAINEVIKTIRVKESLDLADADESAIWSRFEDAAILGDSRAVGFSFYQLLPEDQVMAESGAVITDVSKYIDQLKKLNPELVFLCYGVNDVKSGLWPETADYAAECAAQMQAVMKALPESKVYMNSILPAGGNAIWDASYARIDEYNAALKAMTAERGLGYIDNTVVAQEHQGLYQEDGLHLQTDFYKYWAANMLTGVDEE